MLLAVGVALCACGLLSRVLSLPVYRRISESPARSVTRSWLPGTPWLKVQSDRVALRTIVVVTYFVFLLGVLLMVLDVVA